MYPSKFMWLTSTPVLSSLSGMLTVRQNLFANEIVIKNLV